MPPICRMLDVNIHALAMADVLGLLEQFVETRRPHQIVTVNLDFVRLARRDPAFRRAVNLADLAVADGMPLVWLSRLMGQTLPERIAGIDLLEAAAALAAGRGYRVYLLGAAPGIADAAAQELVRRYPALKIAGTYAPPHGEFSATENENMLARVRAAGADMLFVAFGAPRQDTWIREHLQGLGVPLCMGVGGSFNFLAGQQPRAPRWVQQAGLEWVHRLVHEPRRLWKRYLLGDLPILARIAAARFFPSLG
jgi:N-acetylglucosaminyldiphosphoundecaprenol N-acetyl-beta-D-mannosaminyltransferase